MGFRENGLERSKSILGGRQYVLKSNCEECWV